MSVLQKLTEGIVHRDVSKEGVAMLSKWEQTGLLEGITDERTKNGMAVLLENQAKELLREASGMAAGDVEGFAAVAFPIVRRVFGGLVANDIVSVQPMSLPSGLIFFLDFTKSSDAGDLGQVGPGGIGTEESVHGGGRVARGLIDGLVEPLSGGFYDLETGYSASLVQARMQAADGTAAGVGDNPADAIGGDVTSLGAAVHRIVLTSTAINALNPAQQSLLRHDPDLLGSTGEVAIVALDAGAPGQAGAAAALALPGLNKDEVRSLRILDDFIFADQDGDGVIDAGILAAATDTQVRRLTRVNRASEGGAPDGNQADHDEVWVVLHSTAGPVPLGNLSQGDKCNVEYSRVDSFGAGGALGSVVGAEPWALEAEPNIPEIDIKVDSIAVTAMTKKLKAKWTPELAQDLNAYHSLDAEVELTGILSEQIALEIDREILNDLIDGATAKTLYWSRSPGLFVNRETGADITDPSTPPDFTGTVSEWYETLVETINDVSAHIHRKTLRGGANFLVTSPEVANILEFTSGFRASVVADQDRGSVGAVKAGSISKKWDVYVDPYFPRNLVLVGRKGSSFLESGYVYAPYVPLQTTPTIFGPEDFVPRKGVMTRYAKQMVRPDMFGLVVVRDMLGTTIN